MSIIKPRAAALLEKLRSRPAQSRSFPDAGTPGISDPGADLIRAAVAEDLPVSMAPGPVAGIMALVLSGLPTERFVFEGFIGTDRKSREAFAEMIASEKRTVILYEAPHRLIKTLELLNAAASGRRLAVCRELTKAHEEIRRGTPAELLACFTDQEPRGEFVIVVEGAPQERPGGRSLCGNGISDNGKNYKRRGRAGCVIKKSDALKEAAARLGISKNQAYALYEDGKEKRS